MIEVIWHARGGQGAFTAARCLGAAAAAAGLHALAFPTFGPERRGAPMRAFTKMGTEPLGDRSASLTAPFVFYLDNSLLEEGWEAELTPQGLVLVNTPQASTHQRLLPLDADALSTGVLGHPFPNTAFLGAFPAVCDALTLDHVEEGIRLTMPSRLAAKNIAVARAAYEACLKSVKGGAHD